MLNYLWIGMIIAAIVTAAIKGNLEAFNAELLEAAKESVLQIGFPLLGITIFWLGIMRLAEVSGLINIISKILYPLLKKLFPEVPPDHPAMGSMLLNITANMLGLNNAATPLGLRAMEDLQKLNPHPNIATNAMCMFLAINTSSLQLVPTTAISILAAAGATQPTVIVGPSLIATSISTIVGIFSAWLLGKISSTQTSYISFSSKPIITTSNSNDFQTIVSHHHRHISTLHRFIIITFILFMIGIGYVELVNNLKSQGWSLPTFLNPISKIAIPFMIGNITIWAAISGVKVYEEFIEGAKEGLTLIFRLFPYLVAMIVAIRLLKASGFMEFIAQVLSPILTVIGFPLELLPMALIRPLSGSATISALAELANQYGGDSLIARIGGVLLGSTETTFYVITLYFGAVGIKQIRYALIAGLLADLAGTIASVIIGKIMWGNI